MIDKIIINDNKKIFITIRLNMNNHFVLLIIFVYLFVGNKFHHHFWMTGRIFNRLFRHLIIILPY